MNNKVYNLLITALKSVEQFDSIDFYATHEGFGRNTWYDGENIRFTEREDYFTLESGKGFKLTYYNEVQRVDITVADKEWLNIIVYLKSGERFDVRTSLK